MAYVWSWAFGPETALELDTLTSWTATSTNTSNMQNSNTIKHSYIGDQTDRYSMGIRGGTSLRSETLPAATGWFSGYFYYNGTSDWQNYEMLEIAGPNSERQIEIRGVAGKTITLRCGEGTTFTSSAGHQFQDDTWHHIAVKYDIRTDNGPWSAEVYADGVLISSGSATGTGLDAETGCQIWLGGVRFSTAPADSLFWSDIILYDSQSDPNPYGQYVSRVQPYNDISDSGSWSPASDNSSPPGAQSTNLSGAIATSPVVSEATPTNGEFVRVASRNLGTNLGLNSFNSYGFTAHLFASGSSATNLLPKFALDSNPMVTGSSVIDGINAYGYASSGSTAYASGSVIFFETTVSGS